VDQFVLADHDLLYERTVSQANRVGGAKVSGDLCTQHQRRSTPSQSSHRAEAISGFIKSTRLFGNLSIDDA
jgi:hypothetical protein